MEKLAKFPQAMLAGCPVLCGPTCHHCETCLRFSHRLRSAPRGRWHPGRHQLGLNSGGKTRVPHPPPPGVGTRQEAVSTSVSRLITELSANQHSPLIGQSALLLETFALCYHPVGESALRTEAALVLHSGFVFVVVSSNQTKTRRKKPSEAFDSVNTISELGLIPFREKGEACRRGHDDRSTWFRDWVHRCPCDAQLVPSQTGGMGGRGAGGHTPLKAADPRNKCWQKNVYKGL